ncbi:ABC transporter G family member 28 isoform X2 [Silene latifolia]|uniref:ABC transporter G family member 28 isoform X2 n=1 Tax=Silene latifolia TaxID=37657 RepID=UPI003D77B13B
MTTMSSYLHFFILTLFLVLLSHSRVCQGDEDIDNSATIDLITDIVYERIANTSAILTPEITQKFRFCIRDANADWNAAFNFSNNLRFLSNCVRRTKGDLVRRLCTAAEIKFYFNSFVENGLMGTNYVKLNHNCNLTTWLSGCQPGWACSVNKEQSVNLRDSEDIPDRTNDCQPCCEGFFCPHGLTCMIPCPLGSYCPIATFNKTTGVCDPYRYQLPQGQPNHTCGAADIWADIAHSRELFCEAGSYCSTTIEKVPCSSGHYCRTGSTTQSGCLPMTKCNMGSANQNITAYGILLFVAVTFLLLIIYNCSDQVLATRERRLAKSRDAAAKSARETAQAKDRWKYAKDAAKKHAIGLQTSLSRTFSRRKSVKLGDHSKSGGQFNSEPDLASHTTADASNASQSNIKIGKGKQKQGNEIKKMMQDIEANPDGPKGFNLDIGDKNIKKNVMAKKFQTQSQIFKYAYGQIEKEKALQEQNKNLTFSGLLSMATDIEIRKRPTLEVAFKDLTLTLKGKKKHLMRCVTGKISPGRVSAVMGPSGAGKTTFLSALAGKATGCRKSGMILINGKAESTNSYKKIIGFVPQDDIVHGNLTVEENLWFSARCRLSAALSKAEKVLVLERVIESLGLQGVRDSLVGTLEKRGISGGQRKRVNVGLEMVMEPSLLILDEPTSGLDSSSSLLLLKALRREALEGVNICMVVHQPRVGKQRLREARIQAVDYLILLLAGACLGTLAKVSDETFGALGYTYTVIAVSLLCMIAALRSFSLDKLHYWRESSSGMSSLAYFLAKDTVDHFNTIVKPLVYLSMFYFFNNPRSSILENYAVLLCLVYCVIGIAYVLAIFLEPGPAQLWSVLLPVVLTLIANQDKRSGFIKSLEDLCYPKWAMEAFVLANAQRYSGVWLVTRCGALYEKGYEVDDWALCLCVLVAFGVISRIIAFNFMVIFQRK